MKRSRIKLALVATVLLLAGSVSVAQATHDTPTTDADWAPTPGGPCGPGSLPEETQGRAPAADYASGRAYAGYTCNTEVKGRFGTSGGYRVHRYVDAAGTECAFYDSTLLFPANAASSNLTGVHVLDMSEPTTPKKTANLVTPAMQSPHESLSLNQARGLLAANMGYPTFQPGFVDVYDVSQDCRNPVFLSSLPVGIIGHEGEFSPDGNTYWVTSPFSSTIIAVDVTDPMVPSIIAQTRNWAIHGLNISDDGNRFYGADTGSNASRSGTDGSDGLTILDVSEVQARVPNPEIRLVSHLTWRTVSIPQTAIPVTITTGTPPRPRKFLVEVDEFGGGSAVGAARIIDIEDELRPKVVSNLRLQVNHKDNQAASHPQNADPGASSSLAGYDAHYCSVPDRNEPGIVACSFITSGLRVFDIRDPYHPREIAYFNQPTRSSSGAARAPYAMSAPTFVPERNEIWYSDGNSGFYNIRVTNGVWPFPRVSITAPGDGATYRLGQAAAADYSCGNAASCAGPVASGSDIDTSSVGEHTFTVTATDGAGGPTQASTTYRVVYDTEAFLTPLRNPPYLNDAGANRSTPVKWRLRDDGGAVVTDRTSADVAFSWLEIDCADGTAAPDASAVDAPTTVTYDDSGQHYTAPVKAPADSAGTCQRLTMSLDDGTNHTALFRIT